MTRRQARVELLAAQRLAREGKHEEARELFRRHGISYVSPQELHAFIEQQTN